VDDVTEKMPFEKRLQLWIEIVQETHPLGYLYEGTEEQQAWLARLEDSVPRDERGRWQEKRCTMLAIYAIAAANLEEAYRRVVSDLQLLAAFDALRWIRETDDNGRLRESVFALTEGQETQPPGHAHTADRVRGLGTLLDTALRWSGGPVRDCLEETFRVAVADRDPELGEMFLGSVALARQDQIERAFEAGVRTFKDSVATFCGLLEVFREALTDQGQSSLMPGWEQWTARVLMAADMLEVNHDAFNTRYKPREDTEMLRNAQGSVSEPTAQWTGLAWITTYCKWLGLASPIDEAVVRAQEKHLIAIYEARQRGSYLCWLGSDQLDRASHGPFAH